MLFIAMAVFQTLNLTVVTEPLNTLLRAVGVDALGGRVGVDPVLGTTKVSGLVGLVAYVLILIPVLISPLNALALYAVTIPASEILSSILHTIPALFSAAILITIAYFVGRVASNLISNVLAGADFDNILVKLGVATAPTEGRRPSDLVGTLIMVALMLFASTEAAGMLGFEVLGDLISRFLVLGGQVVLGLVIFGIGLFFFNLAEGAVRSSGARQSTLLALTARISIIVLAGAMALWQMGLANEIINLAFGLLLGAVAAALAFGLAGRDVTGRTVEEWAKSLKGE